MYATNTTNIMLNWSKVRFITVICNTVGVSVMYIRPLDILNGYDVVINTQNVY